MVPFLSNKLISVKNFLHVITVFTQISFWKSSNMTGDVQLVAMEPSELLIYLLHVARGKVFELFHFEIVS